MKRRTDVDGTFPSKASIISLIGAVLLDANDEKQLQNRYMAVDVMAGDAQYAADQQNPTPPPRKAP